MLAPGQRLIESPGALHFYDGRRVVSLDGDEQVRALIRRALDHRALDHSAQHSDDNHPDTDPTTATDPAPDLADPRRLARRLQVDLQTARELVELLEELDLLDPDAGGDPRVFASDVSPNESSHRAAHFASMTSARLVSPGEAALRLRTVRVHVFGGDGADRDLLDALLTDCGLQLAPDLTASEDIGALDPSADVVLALAGARAPATTLLEINERCLARQLTWLPVGSFDGAVLRVGPLVLPGQTACFDCTLQRLAANVGYAELYRDVVADASAVPMPAALRHWSFCIAALTLLRWIGARNPRVPGELHTLDPSEGDVRRTTVLRVPRCPACAAPDYTPAAAPWETARAF